MTRGRTSTVAAIAAATIVVPVGAGAWAVVVAPTAAVAPSAPAALPTGPRGNAATRDPAAPPATASSGAPGSPTGSAVATSGSRWLWPLRPRPAVLRRFEAPATRYGRGHRGIDLAARSGDDVRSVDAGVVSHAAVLAGRGTITVMHSSGLRSTYEPVRAGVHVGDLVGRGDLLGVLEMGVGHCADVLCLHLGALRGGDYVDPLPLLVRGVILLPLAEQR